ncbi:lactate utilization protein [Halarchaeum sp. CBA1220]|uniref:lactate utilization protein n=1 Tax=Halarchaeum sp. CBA1220 TaxID=1853682 RepID=UPI000F3A95FB|nr:lactate utilization protein [Halarchaeum sp. CBA1220]QLC33605.1 lactate utilization protein [Halarchaeum sp. CBA1220]
MSEQTKADYIDDVDVDEEWDAHPSDAELEEAVESLEESGFEVEVVADAEEALEVVTEEIPEGASVMNGHSTTLEEIGFMEYLNEGEHEWENLYGEVFSIDDDQARAKARREAQTADYFLGSVNAIGREDGTLVAADLSGSRIGAYPFAAGHVVAVAGVNKVVADEEAARERLQEYAYAFENERAQEAYGVESYPSKELVFRQETVEGRTTVVLVEETLGY